MIAKFRGHSLKIQPQWPQKTAPPYIQKADSNQCIFPKIDERCELYLGRDLKKKSSTVRSGLLFGDSTVLRKGFLRGRFELIVHARQILWSKNTAD